MLRNLAVGVPLLAASGTAAAQLSAFHTANASIFRFTVDPNFVHVLLKADGKALGSLIEAARTHESAWSFLLLQLRKLAFAWHAFEAPDNVDFYVFRQGAPLLDQLPVRIVLLAPLAALGLVRRAGRAWPLLIAIAVTLAGIVAGNVLARYRAPLVVALLPLAGAGVVQVVAWIGARRWWPVAAAACATALYAGWAVGPPPGPENADRAAYYRANAEWFAQGSPALGALYLLEADRLSPGNPGVLLRAGELLLESGDPSAALPYLTSALHATGSPATRLLRARALASLGREPEALDEARAVLAVDPGNDEGQRLLKKLEPARPTGP